ncbi:hypothetical protein HO133_006970 [Letharia lupina]|uniref:Dolichyl-diphosphooligosaccharide--protein glycosyltransferase subunit 4 n=1 Tax=Letharia lupina TaxID=560253 RepID=A0A8H6FI19_9LECA|nr:uncharacterized protein HO133_006970 [Letharia lupina]KAF6228859.1 hypothetical protein HO133_006970 [Letharia lupina]
MTAEGAEKVTVVGNCRILVGLTDQLRCAIEFLKASSRTPFNFPSPSTSSHSNALFSTMISDDDLYTLAIFLGSLSMLLIVLYHFLEVNAIEEGSTQSEEKASSKATSQAQANTTAKS